METEEHELWNRDYLKVWLANFMIFFSFMLLMPLLPLYLNDTFHANKHEIGVVLSGYTIMALFVRGCSGYIVDSFDRKKVLVMSYALFALVFLGYYWASSILLFALVRTFHGAPFGLVTVSNSTAAIDVLHPTRRVEGIGYYGLSNNIATAISPSFAIWIYQLTDSYELIFLTAALTAGIGVAIVNSIQMPTKEKVTNKGPISLDRFLLLPAWREALTLMCLAFSYGMISTYIAIYGKEELNITGGAGFFFMLLAVGLALARVVGNKSLKEGKILHNAGLGCIISLGGYLLFAGYHSLFSYYASALIIGFGNGHMFPAYSNMFVKMAHSNQRGTANSTNLVSWDFGTGIGILTGGIISEYAGYHTAFWIAFLVNIVGVAGFFLFVRKDFENKIIS